MPGQVGLDSRTRVRDGGGSAGIGVGRAPASAPSTVTHLKLSPIREWRSEDGRTIHAELMSWPVQDPEAATRKVEELSFDVVRDGRIRLRRNDKIFALPLSRLSEEDRAFVAGLAKRLRKNGGSPPGEPPSPAKEGEDPATPADAGREEPARGSGR